MFCSACGHPINPGQPVCGACGRPMAAAVPMVPNFGFQLQNYAGRVRALSIVWFVYGGLSLAFGIMSLAFANAWMNGLGPFTHGPWAHGPWAHGPWSGPWMFGPALIHLAWAFIVVRSGLALLAGWGLMERTQWGRVVAVVAAIFSLFRFPIGTALGIWTLVTLLGYRNSTLYDQL
jgi:hypothetical protein